MKPKRMSKLAAEAMYSAIVLSLFLLMSGIADGVQPATQDAQQEQTDQQAEQTPAPAQPSKKLPIPLVEQQPYDEIQLDDYNKNVTIKILPLTNPPPKPLPDSGYLVFEAPSMSENILQVPFANVVEYRSFGDLLVREAMELISKKLYSRAYRNLLYVYDRGGDQDQKIVKAMQTCLFQDGIRNFRAKRFEMALAIFEEIYRQNPRFRDEGIRKSPIDIILDSIDGNIASKFEKGQFDKVTVALEELEDRYGRDSQKLIAKWKQELLNQSDTLLAEARKLANDGNGKLASLTVRRANWVVPNRPEALQLYSEIVAKYPIVFVGVSDSANSADPLNIDNWGERRVGRLVMRSVVEFSGLSDEGGRYEFLNGELKRVDEEGLVYRFTIDPEKSKDVPEITAMELANELLTRGSMASENYSEAFAKVVATVAIEDERNVVLTLRRPFVRPEALLRFAYPMGQDGNPVQNGAYKLTEQNEQIRVFQRNSEYRPVDGNQHPELVEWRFANSSAAVDALIGGEIDVVDRVPLADLYRLQEDSSVEVRSYIVPTVHMLLPNIRNDFTSDKNYRNGLLRGINRELILNDMICGGREVDGCEVVSGPFPIGTEENDQLAYGYNLKVLTQPFNDKLGMVLAQVVFQQKVDALRAKGEKNPKVEKPEIVLAYADEEIPTIACTAIQQNWSQLGVRITLRKLEPGEVIPPDEDWDFLYYQMSMQEPLTDTDMLLGADGLVTTLSAPVRQNMRKLGYAESWQSAGTTLRRLHRQVKNDVTIIPLWQIKEHYAYRDNVKNIGGNLVHLYQNIQGWQVAPRQDLSKE